MAGQVIRLAKNLFHPSLRGAQRPRQSLYPGEPEIAAPP